jgi:hypothetical protein
MGAWNLTLVRGPLLAVQPMLKSRAQLWQEEDVPQGHLYDHYCHSSATVQIAARLRVAYRL